MTPTRAAGRAVRQTPATILVLAAIVMVPVVFDAQGYIMYVACLAGIYALLVVGLDILYGYSGQVSVGHAAFLGLGAYTTALLTTRLDWSPWISLPAALLVSAVAAFVIAFPSVRLVHHFLALVTIGFGEIVRLAFLNLREFTGGFEGISRIPTPALAGFQFDSYLKYFYLVLVFLAIGIAVKLRLRRSDLGRNMIALKENAVAAGAFGIAAVRTRTIAFVISAVYAGGAGWLLAHLTTYVSPGSFRFDESMLFLMMLLLGGYATVWGPIIGAALLVFLREYAQIFQQFQGLFLGVLLVLVLTVLPRGVVGSLIDLRTRFARREQRRGGRGVLVTSDLSEVDR